MHIYYAKVFTDNACNQAAKPNMHGNAAAVIICDQYFYANNAGQDLLSESSRLLLSQQLLASQHFAKLDPPSVVCFIESDGDDNTATECFSAQGKIQLCGHGSLAAKAVYHRYRHPLTVSAFNPATASHYQSDGQRHWLKLAGITVTKAPIPEWAAGAFSSPPAYAAIAGDNRDYLIFEWPSQARALQTLKVNFDIIKTHTLRAIIATQWLSEKNRADCSPTCDFVQRYFAPQYGSNEDSATGSAHRVLASYWHNKTGQKNFTAWQCSDAGGLLHSHLYTEFNSNKTNQSNDGIWIGGQVQISDIIEISL